MITNNILHPGDILLQELQKRNIRKMAFAAQLQMSNSQFSDLLHGRKSLTEAVAKKLETLLNITADDWMKWQSNYDFCYCGDAQ